MIDSGFVIWLPLKFQRRCGSSDSSRVEVPRYFARARLFNAAFVSLCRAFFDHSMHSALPLGIYLATKFWMYTTWFYWFWNDILCCLSGVRISREESRNYELLVLTRLKRPRWRRGNGLSVKCKCV